MSKHQDLQILCSNETNVSNFQLLEVVDRESETQPKVAEYLYQL